MLHASSVILKNPQAGNVWNQASKFILICRF